MTKFVLLSAARSGTSFLIEILKTHPDALVHGEIFHEMTDWHIHKDYLAHNSIEIRDHKPVDFVDDVLNFILNKKAVGFKMWRPQSPSACDYILTNSSIKKIILRRNNLLAHFSSLILAEKTGVWNVRSSEGPPELDNEKASFDPQQFSEFIQWHNELFSFYEKHSVGETLFISYPDICIHSLDYILDFLDIPKIPISPQTQKLYSSSIINRFQTVYHDEIISYLRSHNKECWLQE